MLTPFQAVLLSLFVPGSAHFIMRRPVRGTLAVVSCVGLFLLGYAILGDRLWRFIWFPPFDIIQHFFKVLPLNLWPEWPNLGCSILASFLRETSTNTDVQANLERLSYLPVPMEHLAFFCTSASGILSAIWAADAFVLARDGQRMRYPKVTPGLAAMASWLLPGSGHWLLGQRDKGLLIGAAVIVMFVAGLLFAAGHAVDRVDSPAYYIAAMIFGGGTLFTSLVTAPLHLSDPLPASYELGVTLPVIAGLMNLIVMIDAYTVAEAQAVPAPEGGEVAS